MRIKNIEKGLAPKLVNGTLPDIDTDFCGRDRAKIKAYMEERFGREQVCSVGTFTTMKIKGLVKDLSRMVSIDFAESNLMTAIIDKSDDTFLDLIRRASIEPKLKAFMKRNSDLFYILPTLLDQPKTQSIHPCALIIFPSVMSSQEWCPVRLQQGLLVSEWGGTEMDDAGFLKEDILGIKQLDKFADILKLIRKNGKALPDIYNLPHDSEVFRYFSNGWNGDVFQLGSSGLTEFTKSLKPQIIDDLIAAVAVYRPGPMENHYHSIYVQCKNDGRAPKYIKGTEEITKDTYGLLVYQEQVMKVFQEIGGLSMRDADDVRRAMGKKKLDVLLSWKEKVKGGFLSKGTTEFEFEEIWTSIEEFAKYCFNKSHSAAYAMTGYVCQYLKVHYPIEYWTIALDYADEADTLTYISEIEQTGKITIKAPDINNSGISMTSKQESSTIYWGLESIKGIGEDTAMQIINERKLNGNYENFDEFYARSNFKGSKIKKQTYEALITAGAFDQTHEIGKDFKNRWLLLEHFRTSHKVKITKPERDVYLNGEINENWWWSLQQKKLTGLAFIEYRSIAEEQDIDAEFCSLLEFNRRQDRGLFRSFGGYIVEAKTGRSTKGEYARLTVEHNYKLFKVLVWSEEYSRFKEQLKQAEKHLIVFSGELRYDEKWARANQFTLKAESKLKVL